MEVWLFVTLFVTMSRRLPRTLLGRYVPDSKRQELRADGICSKRRNKAMTIESTSSDSKQPRDATSWAQYAKTFKVGQMPTGALNLNVEGRRLMSPLQGFGQMWQKTFRVRLQDVQVKPAEVIQIWKENFPSFWPRWDH